MKKQLFLLGALGLALVTASASADEGMWTFDNFPSKTVKAKYGVDIGPAWLNRVQHAAVRLSSGCSASVVSKDGLVLTNHHCVRGCAQNLSTASKNYVRDGFFSATREDEKMCPGMQAEILSKITDVTKKVQEAVAGKDGQAYIKARDVAIAEIEGSACKGNEAKYRCQVIDLYHGGQYKLYTYRKYSDVRLVAAPEEKIAFFGGDPDNFNYPRYDLDFSFVRLYEDGKPVSTPDHLTWRVAPPKVGDPMFVAGNPGSTSRLLTGDELIDLRDHSRPLVLNILAEIRGRLIQFGQRSPENERISNHYLFGVENSYKAYTGQVGALRDPQNIANAFAKDKALEAKVAADPKLAKEIGNPWADIRKVIPEANNLSEPYFFAGRGPLFSSLFSYGRTLVRAAEERAKPNADRLPEYTESRLPLLKKNLLDAEPVYPEIENMMIDFWMLKLREHLTADSPYTKEFLGKKSPEQWAAELSKSKLADPKYREALWKGGMKAIKASNDPMIKYVLATDATSREMRKEYEAKVEAPISAAHEKIAKARFAIYGDKLYPDATFSLRLSYGKVEGWTEKGKPVAPFTHLKGLWQRATGNSPFDLPPRWVNAQSKVDGNTVYDFVTNNDIIGGNSGSPVITAKGEVVGAAFDGNIHSLGGAFFFDPKTNRTVVASTAAITEALKKVYHMDHLVNELTH